MKTFFLIFRYSREKVTNEERRERGRERVQPIDMTDWIVYGRKLNPATLVI